jgi:hypothetical protein
MFIGDGLDFVNWCGTAEFDCNSNHDAAEAGVDDLGTQTTGGMNVVYASCDRSCPLGSTPAPIPGSGLLSYLMFGLGGLFINRKRVWRAARDGGRLGGLGLLRVALSVRARFVGFTSAASTNATISDTSQSRSATPASIAGVTRSVLWMQQKL